MQPFVLPENQLNINLKKQEREMKKLVMSFAALAMMMLAASCGGNKSANAEATAEGEAEAAPAEVTYETFNVEKYGVSIDVPQGMRRTDDPVMDNGALWSFIAENDPEDFAVSAGMGISVYEYYEEYTDEKIQKEFESIPEEAIDRKIDLEKKEYSYSLEGQYLNEYNRVMYKGNLCVIGHVTYSEKHADKLGGDIRDHILGSMKWN